LPVIHISRSFSLSEYVRKAAKADISPHIAVASSLPGEVENKARAVPGASDFRVELVWDPSWSMDMMSEEARLELWFF
jgi:hypothetical protein